MEFGRNTIPWVAGGLAITGLGYYIYRRRKKKAAAAAGVGDVQQNPVESNLVHFPARY